mgnify:CR=1 FL=1
MDLEDDGDESDSLAEAAEQVPVKKDEQTPEPAQDNQKSKEQPEDEKEQNREDTGQNKSIASPDEILAKISENFNQEISKIEFLDK